jgi:hypothetical protein
VNRSRAGRPRGEDRAGRPRGEDRAGRPRGEDSAVGRALLAGGLALARTNHRGRTLSLTSGPALALAVGVASGLPQPAAAVAGLVSGGLGAYDDLAGGSGDKGFRGHLAALREGRLTTGAVKVLGIGAAGLAGAALLPGRRHPVDVLLAGGVVAGSANLLNLLDLRPGRALKAGLGAALALHQPGLAGAAVALLPADLGERQMLGDAGANALGATLGLALVQRTGRRGTALALIGLAGLTAASEVVSFSKVIDAVPPLRAVDQVGRRP